MTLGFYVAKSVHFMLNITPQAEARAQASSLPAYARLPKLGQGVPARELGQGSARGGNE